MSEERAQRSSNDKLRNIMVPVCGAGCLIVLAYAGLRIADLLVDGRVYARGAWRYPSDGFSFYFPATMFSLAVLLPVLLLVWFLVKFTRQAKTATSQDDSSGQD